MNGSVEPVFGMTVVDVTTGTVVPDPLTGLVVVVTTTVDAATCSVVVLRGSVVVGPGTYVVLTGTVVDVVVAVVDVVVDVVEVVVVDAVVEVVVDGGFVVEVVVLGDVVVEFTENVVVVLDGELVLLGGLGCVVVVEPGCVVDVLVDDVLVDEVEVGGTASGPQNCTFETSGAFLLLPTFGRPAFEKVPLNCGGVIEVYTAAVPPFTMTPDTASVEVQVAPEADTLVSVTTCSLPAGFSNLYVWSKLNFAINTDPDGHD